MNKNTVDAKLLHYLKSQRTAKSEMINLLHWILWASWVIRMMSWCHKVLCKPILGKYRWIYLNVSKRNKLEGKKIIFSKTIQAKKILSWSRASSEFSVCRVTFWCQEKVFRCWVKKSSSVEHQKNVVDAEKNCLGAEHQ